MNFNTTIYRECDTGGAHAGGSFNIPGLISKEIESTAKQGQAVKAMQANFGTDKIPPLASMSLSNNYLDQGQFVVGDNWEWQQPVNPLIDHGKYKQFPFEQKPYNPTPFGEDPYKKYGPSPGRQIPYDEALKKEMQDYLLGLKKPKSAFEELIDGLFTTAEKEQVLIDMGYILEQKDNKLVISRKLADGTVKTITNSLDDLFLKEITVKFKNLLMAKASLKLKI